MGEVCIYSCVLSHAIDEDNVYVSLMRMDYVTRIVLFYDNIWPPSKTSASSRVLAVCLACEVFHNNSQNAPCHAGPVNTPADRWRTWQVIADGGWFLVFAHHLFGNRKLYGGRLETNNIVLRLNSTVKCMIVKTFEDKKQAMSNIIITGYVWNTDPCVGVTSDYFNSVCS